MRRVTATEAARSFADVLDAVERSGETFIVERRGRPVARIAPAAVANGAELKRFLDAHPPDPGWIDELRALRAGLVAEDRSWDD